MLVNRVDARRAGSVVTAAAVALSLLFAVGPNAQAAPTPPPNPTDGQLQSASAQKDALAAQIGQLGGELARSEARLQQLQANVDLAEQKVAYAFDESRKADAAKQQADTVYRNSIKTTTDARIGFARYVQAVYIDGRPAGMTGTLLSASNPTSLLEETSFEQYAIENKSGAIGRFQQAQVVQLNAGSKARKAADLAKRKKADALVAQRQAAQAYDAQQNQSASIQASMTQTQNQLDSAASQLATLQGQRQRYIAYRVEQARLAAIAREKARQERIRQAEIQHEKFLAAQAAQAAQRAQRARDRARQNAGGGNSASGNGGSHSGSGQSYNPEPSTNNPPAPSAGGWTAAKGRKAVARARSQIGVIYAWGGGGANGPSQGYCVASAGAPYDCYVSGFDCSGLMMYAWHRGWDHYAATQYSQAGSFHPSISQLLPGDLLFYSDDGSVGSIHHVAIYSGNGQIIQAPNSGEQIVESSMYSPGSISFTTRPLT